MSNIIPQLMTSSELCRKAGTPNSALQRKVRTGEVSPDYKAGRILLFSPDRFREITAVLNNGRIEVQ